MTAWPPGLWRGHATHTPVAGLRAATMAVEWKGAGAHEFAMQDGAMSDMVITRTPSAATERGNGKIQTAEALGRGREQNAARGASEPRATARYVRGAGKGDVAVPHSSSPRTIEKLSSESSYVEENGVARPRRDGAEALSSPAEPYSLATPRAEQGPKDRVPTPTYAERHRLRKGLGPERAGRAMGKVMTPASKRSSTPRAQRAKRGREQRGSKNSARTRADAAPAPDPTGWDTTPVGHLPKTCVPVAGPGGGCSGPGKRTLTHPSSTPFCRRRPSRLQSQLDQQARVRYTYSFQSRQADELTAQATEACEERDAAQAQAAQAEEAVVKLRQEAHRSELRRARAASQLDAAGQRIKELEAQVEASAAARAGAEAGEATAREAQQRAEAELARRREEGSWLSAHDVEEMELQRATLRHGLSTALAHGKELEGQVAALQRALRERDRDVEVNRAAADEARAATALAREDVAAREEQATELRAQLRLLRTAVTGEQVPTRRLYPSPRRKPGLRRCTPARSVSRGASVGPRSLTERAAESPPAGSTRSGATTPLGSAAAGVRSASPSPLGHRAVAREAALTPRVKRAQEAALDLVRDAMATAVRTVSHEPVPLRLPVMLTQLARRRSRCPSSAAAAPFASEAAVGHMLRVLTVRTRAARAEATAGRLRGELERTRRAQEAAEEEATTLRHVSRVQVEDLHSMQAASAEAGAAARREDEAYAEISELRSRLAGMQQLVERWGREREEKTGQREHSYRTELRSAEERAAREAQRADLAASRVRRLEAMQEDSAARFMRQQEESVREAEKDKVSAREERGSTGCPPPPRALLPLVTLPLSHPQERLRRRVGELEREISRLRDQHGTAMRRHATQMEELRRELRRQREQGGGGGGGGVGWEREGNEASTLPSPRPGYRHSLSVAGVSDYTQALRQRVEELEQRLSEARARGSGAHSPVRGNESGAVRGLAPPRPLPPCWPPPLPLSPTTPLLPHARRRTGALPTPPLLRRPAPRHREGRVGRRAQRPWPRSTAPCMRRARSGVARWRPSWRRLRRSWRMRGAAWTCRRAPRSSA